MVTILITGSSGFVGSNLVEYFSPRFTVKAADIQEPVRTVPKTVQTEQLDITDMRQTVDVIRRLEPEIVIHAAGNKNVKDCEKKPDAAFITNAVGTRNVARACMEIEARMVYISTDLVFGCQRGKYEEGEAPHPTTVYGKTKLQGEIFTLEHLDNAAICRSGGIYGKGSPLLSWLADQLQNGRSVDCFTDVFNTPTYAVNLAEMLEAIILNNLNGVFHTVGTERINRFDFFHCYASVFDLDTRLLIPSRAGDRIDELMLQSDASLSSEFTAKKLGITFNSVLEGMIRISEAGGL